MLPDFLQCYEELETNNIHTLEEYDEFIYYLFMGNCPLQRVHNEIEKTASENLQFGHLNSLCYVLCCRYINRSSIKYSICIWIKSTTSGDIFFHMYIWLSSFINAFGNHNI